MYKHVTAGLTLEQNEYEFDGAHITSARIETNTCIIGTGFNTGSIFFPYTESIVSNNTASIVLPTPTKLSAKTDIKVSGIATAAGIASVALRGWIETA